MNKNIKIAFILIFAGFSATSFAQRRPSGPILEAAYLVSTGNGDGTRIRAILSKPLSANFNLGLGFGTENYKLTKSSGIASRFSSFPIVADARYFILKSENSPFLFSNAGYSIKLAPNFEKGLMAAGGIGYRVEIGKSMFMISTGYNYQELSNRNIAVSTIPIQAAFTF